VPLQFYVPYNDITEVGKLMYATPKSFAVDEKNIKTPLAFVHYGERAGCDYGNLLKDAGWTQVTSQLNWHNYHNGDNNLPIWMKLFPENKPDKALISGAKLSMYPAHNSFAYGCGGRLINRFGNFMPTKLTDCNPIHWHKFTTLIRIHGGMKQKANRIAWLEAMHYRELPEFETSEAKYWVNGWKPEEWPKYAGEREVWAKFKMPKPFASAQ
jgi:hypothetical protein